MADTTRPNKDWWRFWSAEPWREWRRRRPAWREYRQQTRRLESAERSSLVAPPRPISPAWTPALGFVALLVASSAFGDAGDAREVVVSVETTTTTSTAPTTSSTVAQTTTTTVGATTTSSPATTTTMPVDNADVILATPVAGPSGDPGGPLPAGAEVVTVVSITDGDTIRVEMSDGMVEPVRLIGVNTPEGHECWADEAGMALTSLAPIGGEIGMTVDVSERDDFDRLLRYLWVGSMSVNEEMVRRGAAIARRYPPDDAMAERFESAQADAKKGGLGLWAPDACGPAADASLEITHIEFDAPGDDNSNLNEEWIRITNNGENLVDLTGWGIRDESASNRYVFPVGFSLAPGESVIVHSGCGDDFGTALFWCSIGSAIWNNGGDTGFITDPNGNVHHDFTYQGTTTSAASTVTTTPTVGIVGGACDPSYPDVCIPPAPPDLDCGDIPHKRFKVVGKDPHRFDGDGDGVGCES